MIQRAKNIGKWILGKWMVFAHLLGAFNTRLLLMLVYLAVIGPMYLLMRLFRKDFLQRKLRQGSYWQAKLPTEASLESLRRQF